LVALMCWACIYCIYRPHCLRPIGDLLWTLI
jgi:hypothetical protein